MPCDLRASEELRKKAIARLEQQLKAKTATVVKTGGRLKINGWQGDRAGFCDECAVNRLKVSGDIAVRQMIAVAIGGMAERQAHTH
jgi:hypothetical protein